MENETKIIIWVENRLASGNYCFTLNQIKEERKDKSEISIKRALSRLVKQKKIISIYKGFYIIIPPSYKNMGIIPPIMFIDDLMKFIGRKYYISMFSAAAIFGAAHQQPQASYICTTLPSIRSTKKEGIVIKYISKRKFPRKNIIQKKTESGYINVSNPILTCLDLISYSKTIGGLSRAAIVIDELSEEINEKDVNEEIIELAAKSDLQRLGYIWNHEINQHKLADKLYSIMKGLSIKLRTCKLISSKQKSTIYQPNRWKIDVNTIIELDE